MDKTKRFSVWHAKSALALAVLFAALTAFIVWNGVDTMSTATRWRLAALTAASVPAGPMTGAVSRDLQPCCIAFSASLLPWCGGALLIGFAVQILLVPVTRRRQATRVASWLAGWLAWFGGGVVSFGHALS